jgi:hypothetical protein
MRHITQTLCVRVRKLVSDFLLLDPMDSPLVSIVDSIRIFERMPCRR